MSITDELREYIEKQIKWLDMTKVHYRNLFAIANRIDAEHENAMYNMRREKNKHMFTPPPTVVDILCEFALACDGVDPESLDIKRIAAQYADKLKAVE